MTVRLITQAPSMQKRARVPTLAGMRAIAYSEYGDNDVLRLQGLPTPKVGPGQILVRVTRAAINPVDWKVMSGALDAMIDAHFPVVPGWDMAGVVEQLGPDVPEFAVGDRVAAYARKMVVSGGTFAEYVTVPAEFATKIPEEVDDEAAAALPLAGLTAKRVVEALTNGENDTVLIHAASGGVGHLATQLAVNLGAQVVGTCSPDNFEKVRGLGATPVEYGDGLVDRVREIAPDGVDAVADLVGGVLEQTLELLVDDGRHVSIADPEAAEKGGRWLWVRPDGAGLAELLEQVAAGTLAVEVDRVLPLGEVAEGFRLSSEGEANGKIVVDVTR